MTASSDRPGPIPRLHVVTDEQILRAPAFARVAVDLIRAHGGDVALHLRGRELSGRELFDSAMAIRDDAEASGTLLVINDRVDVAVCSGAPAIQLPGHSLTVREARAVAGQIRIGRSVHSLGEARQAAADGADFLLAGTVFTTLSHPETEGQGTAWLTDLSALGRPVIAIGGIDAGHAGQVIRAGAHGVAVMRAVWSADDPVVAAGRLLNAIREPAETSLE